MQDNVRYARASSWVSGQLGILAGLILLAAVGYLFASLATWNISDPSLSNANGSQPNNAGGFPGSIFADLFIQFAGLASVMALVPPAVWAWLKILQKPVGRIRKRMTIWLPSVILSAAALACLPRPDTWPLPTGLGGVTGDLVLKIPGLLVGGYPSGLYALFLGMIFSLLSLVATLFAAGLAGRNSTDDGDLLYDPETGEILDDDGEEPGLILGALTHWYFALRARLRRNRHSGTTSNAHRNTGGDLSNVRPGARDRSGNGSLAAMAKWLRKTRDGLITPPDDGLEAFGASPRREPGFRGEEDYPHEMSGDYLQAPPTAPEYGETIHDTDVYDDYDAQDWQMQPASPAAARQFPTQAAVSGRVQPMKTSLKPGARVSREAQPALIADDRFELPELMLLSEPRRLPEDKLVSAESLEQNARLLEGVLEDFGVKGEIINVRPGPVVTLYELEPAPGIKSSRVIGLADDIARSMSAIACRVAVVPGRNAIGIELPNSSRETVYLRELLASRDYEANKGRLPLVLGKTIGGEPVIADLAKMPHLLVAGTTGSGKSVAINTMILSVLYRLSPEQVRLIMIDPKMLELSIYDGIPHLLTPVVTDPKKAVVALKWTVREMEERYRKMSKVGVRNIDGFNARIEQAKKKGEVISRTVQTGYDRETGEAIYETEELELEAMPYIVVIIDEMADLMMVAGKDIEGAIQRLAQMARAAGIHVIMATQRPSVDVITGTIKANFPTRISFQVTSKIDSRTILGEQGAEQLLGMGDMLYMAGGGRIQRVHGPFVSDDEVEKVVNHLKTQGVPQYLESVTSEDDEDGGVPSDSSPGMDALANSNDLYDQAVAVVLRDRKVSTSYIQRRLGIGYNRAASLIERMEKEGLIGAANHAGKREILVPGENETI
ncbi:MAG: DNA translocase FtsK [Rhizobiaceae bacterium]